MDDYRAMDDAEVAALRRENAALKTENTKLKSQLAQIHIDIRNLRESMIGPPVLRGVKAE
jgi:cell division protein FtsB